MIGDWFGLVSYRGSLPVGVLYHIHHPARATRQPFQSKTGLLLPRPSHGRGTAPSSPKHQQLSMAGYRAAAGTNKGIEALNCGPSTWGGKTMGVKVLALYGTFVWGDDNWWFGLVRCVPGDPFQSRCRTTPTTPRGQRDSPPKAKKPATAKA